MSKDFIDKYRLDLFMMYVAADMTQSASIDVESDLKKIGGYQFADKFHTEKVKFHAGKLIKDVDKICSNDFACAFGDIADECREAVAKIIKSKFDAK